MNWKETQTKITADVAEFAVKYGHSYSHAVYIAQIKGHRFIQLCIEDKLMFGACFGLGVNQAGFV
jgi:hypothetical protein